MKRLPLLLLSFLAACQAPSSESRETDARPGFFTSILRGPETEPAAPEPLPPQVLAALPAGVPPSVVQRNFDGCYLISVEVTDPPSGYPLRDAAGTPICDGGPVPAASPGTTALAPFESGTLLAPGDITPPAPIAPLNPT